MPKIHWRPIIFVGLVWLLICNWGAIEQAVRFFTDKGCNPRVLSSCEP